MPSFYSSFLKEVLLSSSISSSILAAMIALYSLSMDLPILDVSSNLISPFLNLEIQLQMVEYPGEYCQT